MADAILLDKYFTAQNERKRERERQSESGITLRLRQSLAGGRGSIGPRVGGNG